MLPMIGCHYDMRLSAFEASVEADDGPLSARRRLKAGQ